MKISSGIIKGRKIKFIPSHRRLRPTTSKVREAIFDILGQKTKGAHFLDLYAGTGAIGCEALSRGASEVVFVEANKGYTKDIKQLLEKFRFTEKTSIITKKVLSFIKWAEANHSTFDIIFLDPPYHTDETIDTMSFIGRAHILRQNGLVIAEHFTKKHLSERFGRLHKVKDYTYGDTVLSLYKEVSDE